MEDNERKAEALAEKIKSLLEEGITTGKIKRETVTIIRRLEKEILTLGYAVEWSVTEWGATVILIAILTEEDKAKFEKIMNELWRKDKD